MNHGSAQGVAETKTSELAVAQFLNMAGRGVAETKTSELTVAHFLNMAGHKGAWMEFGGKPLRNDGILPWDSATAAFLISTGRVKVLNRLYGGVESEEATSDVLAEGIACKDVGVSFVAVAGVALSMGSAVLKTLPFGDAIVTLAEEILAICKAAESNDQVVDTVVKRTCALQHIVKSIQEAQCNKSPSFQELVDILVKLREVCPHRYGSHTLARILSPSLFLQAATKWSTKNMRKRMWGAKKYATLFSSLYDDLDQCVKDVTLAVVADGTANAKKALEKHAQTVSSMMCAQSEQLVLMEQHGSADADALHEKLDLVLQEVQNYDNSDSVDAIVDEVRKFIDTDIKTALQELHETVPALLDAKLADGALAFEKILRDAGLTREQLHDDRARLVQISCELGKKNRVTLESFKSVTWIVLCVRAYRRHENEHIDDGCFERVHRCTTGRRAGRHGRVETNVRRSRPIIGRR